MGKWIKDADFLTPIFSLSPHNDNTSSNGWSKITGLLRMTQGIRARNTNWLKDIPAQWAKIRQGLDIFRISSKCVCLSNGKV